MKKILFWIDISLLYFGLAKFIQENFDCDMYSIYEITEKPKNFLKKQDIVNFKKTWFLHDYLLNNTNLDIAYLEKIEKKYSLNLHLIALNDRMFNEINTYYKFSHNEILLILQNEIKLFEMILDEVNPDYIIMPLSHQQHNHIFYEICKSREIKILMLAESRVGIDPESPIKYTRRHFIADQMDPYLPLPKSTTSNIENNIPDTKKIPVFPKKYPYQFENSAKEYLKGALKFLITKDENVKTHYSYFGRQKIRVVIKILSYEMKKKYRYNFMNKYLSKEIPNDNSKYVYHPLHQEIERGLLLGAPFYSNQFENIKHIASSLPVGYKLIVKEHPNSKTRGWRSVTEMKKIMNLPNVIFLHPLANSNQIVDRSELVISIRGSSGIEAALRNKPSIVFGKVGMYKFSTINVVNSMTELPNTIKQALEQKVDRREIELYLKLVYENTFDFPKNEITNGFIETFAAGGYFANVEIDPNEMSLFIEKHKDELSFLAQKHIEIMKN